MKIDEKIPICDGKKIVGRTLLRIAKNTHIAKGFYLLLSLRREYEEEKEKSKTHG